jgi:hypothetical protein
MTDIHKLDSEFDAVGLEHGRGYRIVNRADPTKTPNLLNRTFWSLQEAREHFEKWKRGYLNRDGSTGRFILLTPRT